MRVLADEGVDRQADIVSDVLASHGNEMRAAFSVITNRMLRIRPKSATR